MFLTSIDAYNRHSFWRFFWHKCTKVRVALVEVDKNDLLLQTQLLEILPCNFSLLLPPRCVMHHIDLGSEIVHLLLRLHDDDVLVVQVRQGVYVVLGVEQVVFKDGSCLMQIVYMDSGSTPIIRLERKHTFIASMLAAHPILGGSFCSCLMRDSYTLVRSTSTSFATSLCVCVLRDVLR